MCPTAVIISVILPYFVSSLLRFMNKQPYNPPVYFIQGSIKTNAEQETCVGNV